MYEYVYPQNYLNVGGRYTRTTSCQPTGSFSNFESFKLKIPYQERTFNPVNCHDECLPKPKTDSLNRRPSPPGRRVAIHIRIVGNLPLPID